MVLVKHHKLVEQGSLEKLREQYPNAAFYDLYEQLFKEAYAVTHPDVYFLPEQEKEKRLKELYNKSLKGTSDFSQGEWVALPWKNEVYHLPDQREFLLLRTARNRGLITEEEQLDLYNKKIGVAGLSVGSNIVSSFVRYGIGNEFTLVDMDTVATHNMNRAPYFLRDHGRDKLDVVADQALSVDPFLGIEGWNIPLTPGNIEQFVEGRDLIVDAFDNFKTKIALRYAAKKHRIPVVSGFDINEGAMLIVERYDTEPDLDISFFLNGFTPEEISKPVQNPRDRTNLFINIIGREHHDEKMLPAVLSVGETLTGYPQLPVATSAAASLWTIAATDIILGKSTKSIRKYLNFGKLISS